MNTEHHNIFTNRSSDVNILAELVGSQIFDDIENNSEF